MAGSDPFTRTPGVAGRAYIDMHYVDRIINSFESVDSDKYVYKIVGLRGSGKSVVYSKIIKAFNDKKEWLVYTLSAAGNLTETLVAKISDEDFADNSKKSSSMGASAELSTKIPIINGKASVNYSRSVDRDDRHYSPEAELAKLVKMANKKGYRILIGIDDIAKKESVSEFLSIIGALLLEGHKVYLLCTGLSKNIEDFSEESNLSFFRRSDRIEIGSLDRYEISDKYQKLLGVDAEESAEMAKFVKGYAYAYQVLGSLYYNKNKSQKFEDLLPEFDKIMFQDSYDLIWKSLSQSEKQLIKIILRGSGKVSEIKSKMESPKSFESLRDRLQKKHIINTEKRGYVDVDLPRFREFVKRWEE